MLYVIVAVVCFAAGYCLCGLMVANDPAPEELEAAEARAEKWKETARLMGEELKKYAPNKGDVLRELGGE